MENKLKLLTFAIANFNKILLVCLFVFIALLNLFAPAYWPYLTIYAVAAAAWFVCYAALKLYVVLRCRKIDRSLSERCDPVTYGHAYHTLLGALAKRRVVPLVTIFYINLSLALTETGRAKDAAKMLADIGRLKTNAGKKGLIAYYAALAHAQTEAGSYETAQTSLRITERLLKRLRLPTRLHLKYAALHSDNMHRLSIAQGDYSGALAVFCSSFDSAPNNYLRVAAKVSLCRVYAHEGDTDNERQSLNYVIQHGNKLHAVALAKAQLAAL